jgi:hypothetical protein
MHHHVIFLLSQFPLVFLFFFSLIPPIETLPSSFHLRPFPFPLSSHNLHMLPSLSFFSCTLGVLHHNGARDQNLIYLGSGRGAKTYGKEEGICFCFLFLTHHIHCLLFFSFMSYECLYPLLLLIVCIPGAVSYSFSCRYVLCQIVV